MRAKASTRNGKSRTARRSDGCNVRSVIGLRKLSVLLEEYGALAEEGAVEKLSELAEEIVEIIAHRRKRVGSSGFYRRRIE